MLQTIAGEKQAAKRFVIMESGEKEKGEAKGRMRARNVKKKEAKQGEAAEKDDAKAENANIKKEKVQDKKIKKPEIKKQADKKEAAKEKKEFDPWKVLRYPHLAEKSMKAVEAGNKLVFIVDRRAGKEMIAMAVEKEFNVDVVKVNTVMTQQGLKKAYVKLSEKHSAGDIATRLGMV